MSDKWQSKFTKSCTENNSNFNLFSKYKNTKIQNIISYIHHVTIGTNHSLRSKLKFNEQNYLPTYCLLLVSNN